MTDIEELKKRLRTGHPLDINGEEAANAIEQLQLMVAVLKEDLEEEHRRKKEWQERAGALSRELEEARKDYQWLLHNGGLLNEFAKTWNPAKRTLMDHIEAEIKAARQQQG